MESDDIGVVLGWRREPKLLVLKGITSVLLGEGIETVSQLRQRLEDDERSGGLRRLLRAVHNVGPKTVDYLGILAGCERRAAVDTHVIQFAKEAGVPSLSYEQLAGTLQRAAASRNWTPGALDAAIWRYMSGRSKG